MDGKRGKNYGMGKAFEGDHFRAHFLVGVTIFLRALCNPGTYFNVLNLSFIPS